MFADSHVILIFLYLHSKHSIFYYQSIDKKWLILEINLWRNNKNACRWYRRVFLLSKIIFLSKASDRLIVVVGLVSSVDLHVLIIINADNFITKYFYRFWFRSLRQAIYYTLSRPGTCLSGRTRKRASNP